MPKVNRPKRPNQSKQEEQHPQGKQQQPSMPISISPSYTQPKTDYPPQQPIPLQPIRPPLPRKELKQTTRFLIVSVIGLVLILGGAFFWRSFVSGTQSTPSGPSSGTWTTTQTFSGNGIDQTEIFTVSNDWQLQWTCDPSSFQNISYNVIVYVYNTDGTLADVAVNTLCSASNTGNSTELHQGGSIYLKVNSEAAWTLTIQELQ